ncbi:MAG: hypothetical protein IJ192_00360 [Clostridia bacterium]|nr:hypothetical protein [Clostridia bacterium]
MASEFIKKVLETEEKCKAEESQARNQAEAKKQQSKTDAANIVAEAHRQVEKMLEDDRSAILGSTEKNLAKEKKKMQAECDVLSEKAKKNTDRVTTLVLEALVK